jgi:hypothetical protein
MMRGDLLSPLIDSGRGRLYLADQSGLVRAYGLRASPRSAGEGPGTGPMPGPTMLWQLDLHRQSYSSPALAGDGTVYVTAANDLVSIASVASAGACAPAG